MGLADLFKPKWKHRDEKVRQAAVRLLTDQDILASIARNDMCSSVRWAAIERITDQSVLSRIVRGGGADASWAVLHLTDGSAVAEIATRNSDRHVRMSAVRRISDQSILAQVAKCDSEADIRYCAVEKIVEHAPAADVATNAADPIIRAIAEDWLKDLPAFANMERLQVARTEIEAWIDELEVPGRSPDDEVCRHFRGFNGLLLVRLLLSRMRNWRYPGGNRHCLFAVACKVMEAIGRESIPTLVEIVETAYDARWRSPAPALNFPVKSLGRLVEMTGELSAVPVLLKLLAETATVGTSMGQTSEDPNPAAHALLCIARRYDEVKEMLRRVAKSEAISESEVISKERAKWVLWQLT